MRLLQCDVSVSHAGVYDINRHWEKIKHKENETTAANNHTLTAVPNNHTLTAAVNNHTLTAAANNHTLTAAVNNHTLTNYFGKDDPSSNFKLSVVNTEAMMSELICNWKSASHSCRCLHECVQKSISRYVYHLILFHLFKLGVYVYFVCYLLKISKIKSDLLWVPISRFISMCLNNNKWK